MPRPPEALGTSSPGCPWLHSPVLLAIAAASSRGLRSSEVEKPLLVGEAAAGKKDPGSPALLWALPLVATRWHLEKLLA